jgi:hypothetical protein
MQQRNKPKSGCDGQPATEPPPMAHGQCSAASAVRPREGDDESGQSQRDEGDERSKHADRAYCDRCQPHSK